MITVKLYGLFRLAAEQPVYQFEIETINDLRDVISLLAKNTPLNEEDWKKGVLYINGVPIDRLKMFRSKLKDGDIVSVLSPASGG